MKRLLLSALLSLVCLSAALGRPARRPDLVAPVLRPSISASFRISGTSATVAETVYFGGTRWAPDSMRWEAIKDSVWTFDTGVGSFIKESGHSYPGVNPFKPDGLHGGMEGWIGRDNTYSEVTFFRRLGSSDPRWHGSPCVGSTSGLQGQYSFWAGALPTEAESLCFVAGKGYGNAWNVCIEHLFPYAGGTVHLSFQFHNDTEDGFDSTFVYCDTSGVGNRVQIQTYTGNLNGTAQFDLTPGVQLPELPKPIKLQFCVVSDATWSDQDGLDTNCGAFAVDNIALTGGITYASVFETDDGGWTLSPFSPGPGGDWSNLAYLGDLPLPESLAAGCAIRDSVLVFFDPANPAHPQRQDNVAISPWIDLERFGLEDRTGYFINLGGYFDLPLRNYVFVQTQAQWFPDTCRVSGEVDVSPWTDHYLVFHFGDGQPVCNQTYTIDFFPIIPPGVQEVRVGLGVVNFCRFFDNCTHVSNASPWFDNVRFAAYKNIIGPITIQDAIDQAAAGDTVWVPPGLYSGSGNVNLTFRGKNIVLKSVAGAANTIVDGSGSNRGFVSDQNEDSTSAVIGFRFQNCHAPYEGIRLLDGGAAYVGSGSFIRFEDCVFSESIARDGGGVYTAWEAAPSFQRCSFSGNAADERGGGLFLVQGKLVGCTIDGNTANFGGGIYGGKIELQDCVVTRNRAIRSGAIELDADLGFFLGTTVTLRGTTVAGNVAQLAGGFYGYGLFADRCIFWGNHADSLGADVYLASKYAEATFACSNIDSSQIVGQVTFEGPQVFSDPFFCLPSLGDFRLAVNSPCLPSVSPCDSLIGALGLGCGYVSVLPPPAPDEPPFLKTPGISAGPNPFRGNLTVHYLAPFGTDPRLEIFSVDGRLVGKWALRPGSGVVAWNGTDPIGKPVASGIYLLRYTAGDLRVVRRVVRISR